MSSVTLAEVARTSVVPISRTGTTLFSIATECGIKAAMESLNIEVAKPTVCAVQREVLPTPELTEAIDVELRTANDTPAPVHYQRRRARRALAAKPC